VTDTVTSTAADVGERIQPPFLVYFGDVTELGFAKTGLGLIEWRREQCLGQRRLPGCILNGGIQEMSIDDAIEVGVKTVVVGVAPAGGVLPQEWIEDLAYAAKRGLNIASGLHTRLSDSGEIAAAASDSGARLIDVRIPPEELPIGTGIRRSGRRLLTVGTDCAVGKKYTALAIEKEMIARGLNAKFRASGQTGIMIAGQGIPIDSVVADFVAGAAECLSPPAEADHWDLIEGQGALMHPSYAGVSLGLLHGSQPDALVICHDPARQYCIGTAEEAGYELPSLAETISINLQLARRVNPDARFVGVSLNSSRISEDEYKARLIQYGEELGLPVVDPIRDGTGAIVDRLLEEFL